MEMLDARPPLRPSASVPALNSCHHLNLPSSARLSHLPQTFPMAYPSGSSVSAIDAWPYHALQAEAAKHSIRRNLGAAKLRLALKQTFANNGSTAELPREWLIVSNATTAAGPSRPQPLPPPKPAARPRRPKSRPAAAESPEPIKPTVPAPPKLKSSVQSSKPAASASTKTENPKRPIRPMPAASVKDPKPPRKPLHARLKQNPAVPDPPAPSVTVRKTGPAPKASRRSSDPPPMDVDTPAVDPPAVDPPAPAAQTTPQPPQSPESSQGLSQALRREADTLGLGGKITSATFAELTRLTQQIIESLGAGAPLLDAVRSALPADGSSDHQTSRLSAPSFRWAIPQTDPNALSLHSGNSRDSLGPRVGLGRYVSTPGSAGFQVPLNPPHLPSVPYQRVEMGVESDDDEGTQSEIESMLLHGTPAPPGSARRKLAQMEAAGQTDEFGPLRKKTKLTPAPVADKIAELLPIDEARESGSSVPSGSRQTSSGPDAPTGRPSGRRPGAAVPPIDLQKLSLFPVRKTTGARLLEKPQPDSPSASPVSRPTLFGTENLYGDTTAQPFGEMFDRAGRYGGFPGYRGGDGKPGPSGPVTTRRPGKK